jgi:tRNA 2-thiouridine synthesizing protein A
VRRTTATDTDIGGRSGAQNDRNGHRYRWEGGGVDVDEELDCRGMRCPLPIIRLANNIGDVAVGATLGLVTEDPAARPDVQAWCRMREQEYVGEDTAPDGVPRYVVRRLR